ncbi:MAG: hypothetical protein HSCHL_0966 [Hydrogenibacillus schlegelii]|uniref:PIN domain-containing protein n=1 Tax=Hydrogenibacillus schlegelii TaxID=1484 RepID=A0A2T5G6S5_HYDSH|nr:hypothetical protein [Hydrogenibacillus schlegelii]PTQ51890.1 MAG: hypothetical protein HSCHL_0966 [Hydrogenibacillus schlegelii]
MNRTGSLEPALVDTSILIDLFKCNLLSVLPKLVKAEVLKIALILETEPELRGRIRSSGYIVPKSPEKTDAEAVVIETLRKKPGLSVVDALYLHHANTTKKMLLTGDGSLRKSAAEKGVEVHGLLWILQTGFDRGVITREELCACLKKTREDATFRLPEEEVDRMIKGICQ